MKYYLSSPENTFKPARLRVLNDDKKRNYLLSFGLNSTSHFNTFYQDGKNTIMIDSGAFSAWNSGKEINLDAYIDYCKKLPEEVYKINLDVIPKTGSSQEEKLRCIERGFENYLKMKSIIKNVLPVHHYGEDIMWAKRMLQETDYICISPANDTHENVKREYFNYVFGNINDIPKVHVLGYSSVEGLEMYPFHSVDSISYKKSQMFGGVYYERGDGSIVDLDMAQFAKIKGFVYLPDVSLSSQPELLGEAVYECINSLTNHFERLEERNKTRDFSWLKSQLTLF